MDAFVLRFVSIFAFIYSVICVDSLPSCQSHFIFPEIVKNRRNSCSSKCSMIPSSDPRFDDLRRHANNLRFLSDAAYIAVPQSAKEVASVLRYTLQKNLRPTIRSGGHCYEDFWSNNTGGVLIDLSAMKQIYRLPGDETIWVEAGVKIEQLYDDLYKLYGLTAPAGDCLDMGIGGHVAGAGYGSLARKYGVIIDVIDSMELVYVNASREVDTVLVGVNSELGRDKDLFWALRGGGSQNFGVITKIGFRNLPISPPLVYAYDAKWILGRDVNKQKFLDMIGKYIRFFVENSEPDSKYCDLDTNLVITRSRADGIYMTLTVMVLGEKRELADEFFAYLGLNNTNLMTFTCDEMSYYRFTRSKFGGYRNDISSDGHYYVRHSAYMVGPMPIHQRDTLWHYMTDLAYSFVHDGSVQICSFGGAAKLLPENATAYPHRKAVIKIQYAAMWYKPEDELEQRRWSREFYRAMYGPEGPKPDNVMDGCFVNYPDRELIDWQHLYFKGNYERLQQVKQKWDPLNIFRHRQSIELPAG